MKLPKLTQAGLGSALNISQGMVSKLGARGMPTDDLAAARRWRETHLDPCLVKSIRRPDSAPADRSGDDPALRAVGPGAGLDLHVYGLLWAARPWVLGGILAALADHGTPMTRDDVAIVHSAVCAALATVLEAAGEAESTLWHLAGVPVSDRLWAEAEACAAAQRAAWAECDGEPPPDSA